VSDNKNKIEELSKRLVEPEWLFDWRKAAFEKITTLPRDEKYGIAISALELKAEPELSQYPDYEVNASKGLELYTWKEAMAQEEIAPILERLLGSPLLPAPVSKEQALGRAFFQSGLVVYVQPHVDDKGEYQKETLDLTTTLSLGAASDIVIVIAKEGAQLSMQSILKGGEDSSIFLRTFITLIEGEAKVNLVSRTDNVRGFVSLEHRALVSSYSAIDIYEDPSSSSLLRSDIETLLLGQEASSTLTHVMTAEHASQFDVHAHTVHHASNTTSNIYALGTGGGTSRTVYRAAVNIKPGIKAVKGAQEGKFLVLSDTAEVDAIPILDIASNEVASTHKLSVSHIRDTDLFYAKSRGLSDDDARSLILEGFFGSLFEKLGKQDLMEKLTERLTRLVTAK
jgi:Fe-S cluster assembly scaffold protein SufB